MPFMPRLVGAATLASCFIGTAGAQEADSWANRLPRSMSMAGVCGVRSEGRGVAAWFAAGSPSEPAGASEHTLRYVLKGLWRDGGWVFLTGHADAAEASEAGRLDRRRAEFVRDWLTARGVRPERIWVGGRGAFGPVVAADGEAPENRRVDFFLTHQGAACEQEFRDRVRLWLLQHCVRAPHAAGGVDCDEASRLLR